MLLQLSLATETAWAQAGALGNISGKAADETGGVLPGVTVTATSPALQVRNVTAVTDAEGNYRLRDLPAPGMYRVVFELPGFQTIAFDGVSLTAGFTARIDAAMKVSTVAETVEVSGQSPVVDTVGVAGVSSITLERIESIPLGLGIQNLLPMAAGVSLQGSPDVGDSQLANRQRIVTYGVALTPTLEFEGINSTTAHQGNTALYLDFYQVEEASFKTTGNNADVAFGGVYQQMIMKSGGNTFHGSAEADYENKNWQSNNVSDDLAAQGFKVTNPTTRYYDCNGDFGGYILKNKLWFYGGASKQEIDQLQIGYVKGPNAAGCWTCGDAPPGTVIRILKQQYSKFQWQASPSTKVIGTFVHAEKVTPFFGFSATTPEPTTRVQSQPTRTWKLGTQSTPNNHVFVDAAFGFCCYWTHYKPQPGTAVAGNPASQETTTGILTGPLGAIPGTVSERYQGASVNQLRDQNHNVKVGTDLKWERQDSTNPTAYPSGSYTLFFNRGVPNEIRTYNLPVVPIDRLYSQAAFVTDTWTLRTGDAGLRRQMGALSQLLPGPDEGGRTVQPRANDSGRGCADVERCRSARRHELGCDGERQDIAQGVLRDLRGYDGGRLLADLQPEFSQVTTRYRWTGPCVVTPATNVSFNLSQHQLRLPAGKRRFQHAGQGTTSARAEELNTLPNPDLKQNKNYEASVRLDRQLVANVGVGFAYVYHRHTNWYDDRGSVNVGRPYDVWTVPVV